MLILSPELLTSQRREREIANDVTTRKRPDARYEGFVEHARVAKRAGDLPEALRQFDLALEEANRLGAQERIDRATCNRISVALAVGQGDGIHGPLRSVLARQASVESAFLAADTLSRAYEQTKEFKKGLFYAQIARSHARAVEHRFWLASTFNQAGNCLVGDSRFEEARAAYCEALALVPEAPSTWRAGILLNLGYCAAVLDDLPTAFGHAFRSLRWYRRFGDRRGCAWAHLDLCHAYAQAGRAERACRHGERALAEARVSGETGLLKNVLFMLGDAKQMAGFVDDAYELFDELQRSFYPDQPQLVEVMLAVNLRKMVNLRA